MKPCPQVHHKRKTKKHPPKKICGDGTKVTVLLKVKLLYQRDRNSSTSRKITSNSTSFWKNCFVTIKRDKHGFQEKQTLKNSPSNLFWKECSLYKEECLWKTCHETTTQKFKKCTAFMSLWCSSRASAAAVMRWWRKKVTLRCIYI